MANSWETYEPENNSWDEYEPEGEQAPAPQKMEGNLIGNAAKSMWNALKPVPGMIGDFERNLAAGAYPVATEATGAVLGFGEDLGSNAINTYNKLTGQPQRENDNTLSDFVKGTGRQAAEMIKPEDQGKGGRVVEEIGAYALPSAGVTKMMINSGALLANAPRQLGMFENMLVQSAKNPRIEMALDQTISAMMATAGQLSDEAGLSPMQRALVELTTGVVGGAGLPKAFQAGKKMMLKTDQGMKPITEKAAGKWLNDVAAEDPKFWETFKKNLQLSKKHGIDMDMPELTANPELKGAKKILTEEFGGGSTRELKTLESQEAQVRQAFDFDPKAVDQSTKAISKRIQTIESGLQKQIDNAEALATKEALPFNEASIKDAGESALIRLEEVETKAAIDLSKMYENIGFDVPVKTGIIRDAINSAKRTDLPGNQWRGELPSHLKSVTDNLVSIDDPIEELTLKGVQELQGLLKSEIRVNRAAGKDQLVRELSNVLDSTYKQLDEVTGLSQESITLLKSANKQARLNHTRFDDARISMLNKVDQQGIIKTAPEDVTRNLVKSDTQTNSVRAVEAYQNAIKDPVKAKEVLRKVFMAKLAFNSLKKPPLKGTDQLLNVKATENFLNQHKNFLKTSGLDKEFIDTASASKAMDNAADTLNETMKQISRTELSKMVDSDDVVQYVASAIKSGRIKKLISQAKNDPVIIRGINEAAWEGVLKGSNITRGMTGFEKHLTNESLKTAIQNNGKNLELALGEAHFKHTEELMSVVESISMKPARTAGFVTDKAMEDLTAKLLTGLRAAAHGFVRPDLIVAQAGKRAFETKALTMSKDVVSQALSNPAFAKKLMETYRQGPVGKRIIETTLAPFAGTAITLGNSEE